MTLTPQQQLAAFPAKQAFFIGIDSDGCAFDTMELKHKECFCPVFIDKFHCQAVSKYARETWEFVNLYSKWRGCNRWLGVVHVLDLLRKRPEVQRRKARMTPGTHIREFTRTNNVLSNESIQAAVGRAADPEAKKELTQGLEWSAKVNRIIAEMVHDVPPFPFVRECLEKARSRADMMVVSQTPADALVREWHEHGIDAYTSLIAGQELGTKSEHIQYATTGKYTPGHVLMIGDAPGDLKAARENKALFYPINPGDEESSWQRLHEEGLDRFFDGTYAGDYEKGLVAGFEKLLPATPLWEK